MTLKPVLSPAFKKLFLKSVIKWVDAGLVEPAHEKFIHYSRMAMLSAFDEASVDINFLCARRGLVDGISEGKLAGVLLFRFARNRFLHFSFPLTEDERYRTLQESAVINALFEILQMDIKGDWFLANVGQRRMPGSKRILLNVVRELLYLLTARHSNQETAALFFDTMCHLDMVAKRAPEPAPAT